MNLLATWFLVNPCHSFANMWWAMPHITIDVVMWYTAPQLACSVYCHATGLSPWLSPPLLSASSPRWASPITSSRVGHVLGQLSLSFTNPSSHWLISFSQCFTGSLPEIQNHLNMKVPLLWGWWVSWQTDRCTYMLTQTLANKASLSCFFPLPFSSPSPQAPFTLYPPTTRVR